MKNDESKETKTSESTSNETHADVLRWKREAQAAFGQRDEAKAEMRRIQTRCAALEDQLKASKEAEKSAREARERVYSEALIPAAIRRALGKVANLVPEAADDAIALLRARFAVGDDGQVFIRGDDGQPACREDGRPLEADAYVADWVAGRKHFLLGDLPAGTGLPPGGDAGAERAASTRDNPLAGLKRLAESKHGGKT